MAVASSSATPLRELTEYDVFLNFRGKDTRAKFISHLFDKLREKNIIVYKDDVTLPKGDKISNIFKAIESSSISLIISSERYASSSWCLDELVHILRCMKENDQFVIPVFYHIEPSIVRYQLGTYATDLDRLERHYKDKISTWRDALTELGDLSGFHPNNYRNEADLIKNIVEDILKKLKNVSSSDMEDGLVGIDEPIEKIISLLCIDSSEDVRIIGLWGMGGLGKTTLANVVFNRLASKFQGSCFLNDIRENSTELIRDNSTNHVRENSINHAISSLREKLFSGLLKEENPNLAERRLQLRRVLIVLDDVSSPKQLEVLGGKGSRFGAGSRIIVTTRDRQILTNIGAHGMYQVKNLRYKHALHLFHRIAFNENCLAEDYNELLERAVQYTKGVPIAIKFLSMNLQSKSKEDWESELNKLKRVPNMETYNVLRISYDGLGREMQDNFLDIACFLKGWYQDDVKSILDASLSALIDKSLISIMNGKVWMHDLLQEMGREVVLEKFLEMRTWLWIKEDVYNVLENNLGTPEIRGISLDISGNRGLRLTSTAFKRMNNLRILSLYDSKSSRKCKIDLSKGLECLPDALRCLCWHGYTLKSFPSNFNPKNLVKLAMPFGKFKLLWNRDQELPKLRLVDLAKCEHLTRIPDLSGSTDLKAIRLEGCRKLLNVRDLLKCASQLKSLQVLNLSGCPYIDKFPELPRTMRRLNLSETEIKEVPSSINNLSSLEALELRDCKGLVSIPTTICKLESLRSLDLSGCSMLGNFPEILEPMNKLVNLDLSRTAIKELPSKIENLVMLQNLKLEYCSRLELSPENINTFSSLSSLEILNLNGSTIEELPASFKQLSKLSWLFLSHCKNLKSLPELPPFIEKLLADNCPSLETVARSRTELLDDWSQYPVCKEIVDFSNCPKLDQDAQRNITADAKLRIMRMAHLSYTMGHGYKFAKEASASISSVSICCPGNEVPEWFEFQTDGFSINLELPPQWFSTTFLGFAVCVVAKVWEHKRGRALRFRCESHLKSDDGDSIKFNGSMEVWYHRSGFRFSQQDHMFMLYDPCLCFDVVEEKKAGQSSRFQNVSKASFNFFVEGIDGERLALCNVEKCGISLVYAQDAEVLSATDKRFGKPRWSEEGVTPNPRLNHSRGWIFEYLGNYRRKIKESKVYKLRRALVAVTVCLILNIQYNDELKKNSKMYAFTLEHYIASSVVLIFAFILVFFILKNK